MEKWKGVAAFGLALTIFGVALVVAFSKLGIGSIVTFPLPIIVGVNTFAIFYIMAQFVERVVEPFSEYPRFGSSSSTDDNEKFARALSIWGFASLLGMLLCYFTIGLFQVVGVSFSDAAITGHTLDAILSGVIIGGGTKPLHDLIALLETKKTT